MPEKFENTALFLWLGLPSALIRPQTDRKYFENGAVWRRCSHDNLVISLTFSSNTNPKGPVIVALLISSDVVWILRFQSEGVNPPYSNFSSAVLTGLNGINTTWQMYVFSFLILWNSINKKYYYCLWNLDLTKLFKTKFSV